MTRPAAQPLTAHRPAPGAASRATARRSLPRRLLTHRWAPLGPALLTVARTRALLSLRGLDATEQYARAAERSVRGAAPPRPAVTPLDPLHHERVVAWSVAAASRLVPGATCLTQALAGQRLLARHGLGSRVRIGVRPGPAGELLAHAWLLREERVLLGGAAALAEHHPIRDLTTANEAAR